MRDKRDYIAVVKADGNVETAYVNPGLSSLILEMANCLCCNNNFDDPEHRHNSACRSGDEEVEPYHSPS